jgi:hypothetical protein
MTERSLPQLGKVKGIRFDTLEHSVAQEPPWTLRARPHAQQA